ncbi:MAG: uracil-xanthine permease family protein [Gammaproteobacteria bacterium]
MSNPSHIRYEPHEKPPHRLAAALGFQVVALIVAGILITPITVARAAGLSADETAWVVFAALLAAGLSTWLQSSRFGVIGSGYVMFVGSNVAFVSVATAAAKAGGLPLMATLGAISALSCFLFTWRLGALRKVLTPAVGGTVMMLMALSVMPVVWGMLARVPPGFEAGSAAPVAVLCTLVPVVLVSLFGSPMLRLWAPIIGVLIGSAVAAGLGMINVDAVLTAPWLGLPQAGWPGLSLDFGPAFWGLLPAFVLISLVACLETYADGSTVQRAAHREPRPIDFRAVQGAINADGVGSFIAGVLGTVPNTVYSSGVAVMEMTGVLARRVGFWGGLFMVLLAFSPKIAAVVGAIPSPVAGAFILVLIALLFGNGLRMVTDGGLSFEEGLAVCLGFFIGTSFQNGHLFNERFPESIQVFLSNGTTTGALVAMGVMGLLSLRRRSRDRISVPLAPESVGTIRPIVQVFAKRLGWDDTGENRLMLACEEAILFLLEQRAGAERSESGRDRIHLRLTAVAGEAEVELICAPSDVNVQAAVAALPATGETDPEADISLRLLRGFTREIRHQQYHGVEYLLLRVAS